MAVRACSKRQEGNSTTLTEAAPNEVNLAKVRTLMRTGHRLGGGVGGGSSGRTNGLTARCGICAVDFQTDFERMQVWSKI